MHVNEAEFAVSATYIVQKFLLQFYPALPAACCHRGTSQTSRSGLRTSGYRPKADAGA